MLALLKVIFYIPLYNGLIFLIGALPGSSIGAAVILFTALVKFLLFPLTYKATLFQYEMRQHETELKAIKERYKNDRQAQGKATLEFYRKKGINPFAGMLPVLIQIPIVISLYYVFAQSGLPEVNTELLYSFIAAPEVSMQFFGVDMGAKSVLLAALVGLSQFAQGHFALPPAKPKSETSSFQDDFARGMQLQMRYFLPVFMAFVSYALSGAVALYFITSNLFSVGQELYIRRTFQDAHARQGGSMNGVRTRNP